MKALWNQMQDLHPKFAAINRCLEQDWFLLHYELRLQRAHAKTLREADVYTSQEHARILCALDRLEKDFSGEPCPESAAEDLHTWMELQLKDLAGEAGCKIHTARSRNDQVATLLKMYLIEKGGVHVADFGRLIETGCRRAKDWSDLAFPLQTHCQFAAPGNVGFWVLSYMTALSRVRRHLRYLVSDWRRSCPLGSGAVAGSSIAIDRQVQAAQLGFGAPSLNALESTSCRDECLELLALLAQTALHLQSFATDVIMFSQTPLNWTVYPGEFATGSSMMPNKTNPDAMELLRGECNAVLSAHQQAVMILKGLPRGYNRDLQCIKPVIRHAVETMHTISTLTECFLGALEFNSEQLFASLELGHINATLHMESKVKDGMALRDAHHAVAKDLSRSAMPTDIATDRYETQGSANPVETRRVADELLTVLKSEGGRED